MSRNRTLPYTRLYFIGSKLLAQAGCPRQWADDLGAWVWPKSHVFGCRSCGEVYARVVAAPHPAIPFRGNWHFHSGYCEACAEHCPTWRIAVPGSVWISHYPEYTGEFPQEVIEREFHLHLNQFERELV